MNAKVPLRAYEGKRFVLSDGTELFYRDFPGRTGKTVVFLSGLTANSVSFYTIIDLLGDDYRCIAVDYRGRGESGHSPAGTYGVQAHAADVIELIDSLGLAHLVLAAHSFGCYVSTVVAAKRPDLVKGLVLVEGGKVSISQDDLEKSCQAGLKRTQMTFPSLEAYYRFWHQTAPYMDAAAWTPYFDAYIASDVKDVGDGSVQCRAMGEAIAEDTRKGFTEYDPGDYAPHVTAPVVSLWAPEPLIGDSPMYSADALKEFCGMVGGDAKFAPIPGANHMTSIYNPKFARQIADEVEALS